MKIPIHGIVLAGGKSSRFGEDKALATMNGKTLLETAVNRLKGLGLCVTVITNCTRDYSCLGLGCDIQRDIIEEKGPLGGLYTAFRLFEGKPLLVLSCDMPLVDPGTLKTLVKNYDEKSRAALFLIKDFPEPFPGIYKSDLAGLAFEKLSRGQLSMHEFIAGIPRPRVIPHLLTRPFVNINRKEDIVGHVRSESALSDICHRQIRDARAD